MAELVSDELWKRIEPLLPPVPPPSRKGGRPRVQNREALTGIVFVLRTSIPWQALPRELGCGSGEKLVILAEALQASGASARVHLIDISSQALEQCGLACIEIARDIDEVNEPRADGADAGMDGFERGAQLCDAEIGNCGGAEELDH